MLNSIYFGNVFDMFCLKNEKLSQPMKVTKKINSIIMSESDYA